MASTLLVTTIVACGGDDAFQQATSATDGDGASAEPSPTPRRTCVLCTPSPGPIVREGWRRFDADDGFSIEYQEGWAARNEEELGDAWFNLPAEPVYVYIGFNRDPAIDFSLEELQSQQVEGIRKIVGVEAEILEPAILAADTRASVIRYVDTRLPVEEAVISATFIFSDHRWVAQLHAPPGTIDGFEEVFRQMLASLEVHWGAGNEA